MVISGTASAIHCLPFFSPSSCTASLTGWYVFTRPCSGSSSSSIRRLIRRSTCRLCHRVLQCTQSILVWTLGGPMVSLTYTTLNHLLTFECRKWILIIFSFLYCLFSVYKLHKYVIN